MIDAEELDRKFDEGKEDVLQYFDVENTIRPNQPTQRINVDIPTPMVRALDAEARRIGVTRQSIIKLWLAERLETTLDNRVRRERENRELAELVKEDAAGRRPED